MFWWLIFQVQVHVIQKDLSSQDLNNVWEEPEVLMSIKKLLKSNHLHGHSFWGNAYHMASVGTLSPNHNPLYSGPRIMKPEPLNQPAHTTLL